MGWKSNGPPTAFLQNGKIIRFPKEIANIQMKFFHDKIEDLKMKLPNKIH